MSVFYQIKAPNGRISYLFGTMHTTAISLNTLPSQVKQAIDQARTCVFEANMFNNQEDLRDYIFQLKDKWHNEHASTPLPDEYILSVRRNLKKIYDKKAEIDPRMVDKPNEIISNIHKFSPLQLAQHVIEENRQPVKDESLVVYQLDLQLAYYADSKLKRICYLETAVEQNIAHNGFELNMLEQIELYHFIISGINNGKKYPSIEDIWSAYQEQDIDRLQHGAGQIPDTTNAPEPVRRYYDGILLNRDLKMAQKMKAYLDIGNAFVAVGASHLKGILSQLQTEGYIIQSIPIQIRIEGEEKTEALPIRKQSPSLEEAIQNRSKVIAFKKIYKALYMAQTSFFKKRNFLPTDDDMDMTVEYIQKYIEDIQEYITVNKNTRSYKAWELAEKHYNNTSFYNSELCKAICQEGYAKSSSFFGVFRRTKTDWEDPFCIEDAGENTRTGTVRTILGY